MPLFPLRAAYGVNTMEWYDHHLNDRRSHFGRKGKNP